MNQGRIWCVVSPNVGLPLLLGSVAGISLIVHAAVMTHTSWMSNYWQGTARRVAENTTGDAVATLTPQGSPAFAVTVSPVPGIPGKTQTAYLVTVTPNAQPGQTAQVLDSAAKVPGSLAMAGPPGR